MSRTWRKEGVIGDLIPQAQKGLGRVIKLYYSKNLEYFITSLREGTHSPGSFHAIGQAWDAQGQNVSVAEIKEALGPDFDVLPSNAGAIHHEYDPK